MTDTRLAHVKRIFADEEKTRWIDVLRLDRIFVSASSEDRFSGVGKWITLKWDDEDQDWPTDRMEFDDITLEPPEDVSGDPIEFKAVKKLFFSKDGQGQYWHFKNTSDNILRQTRRVRIPFRDNPDVEIDSTMGWKDYLEAYKNIEPDNTSYIDAEIVYSVALNNGGQLSWNVYDNKEVLSFIGDEAPSKEGTVYRLDPFQMIVNINWGATADIMHLLDATGSNAAFNDAYIVEVAKFFYKKYAGSRQGYANFTDFPIDPYGVPDLDFVYRLYGPLLSSQKQRYAGWSQFEGNGADLPEAQLDAMAQCAEDPRVGWTYKKPQIIVCYTDTSPHLDTGLHMSLGTFQNTMMSRKIYPIYIGSYFEMGIGENITDKYPTAQQLAAAIDRGIKYCRANYL